MIITVQSANRSESVKAMSEALFPLSALWFVPSDQEGEYRKNGAEVVPVDGTMPMKSKQLNAALDFAKDDIVTTMDDDFIKAIEVRSNNDKITSHKIPLSDAIDSLSRELCRSKYYMAGVASNLNPFWSKQEPSHSGMVLGQILIHKPNSIRFDEKLTQLEDLDYVIQHYDHHRGICKMNNILMHFHMNNGKQKSKMGGYAGHRTKELQQETLRYIKSKYDGSSIQNHIIFDMDAEVGKGVTRKMRWKKLTGDRT